MRKVGRIAVVGYLRVHTSLAAGPGFEPGLSDSESELLFTGAYRGVRECGVNKPFILYWSRTIIYRVPPNIARVGVKVGVK
jgi:hypothetical protein